MFNGNGSSKLNFKFTKQFTTAKFVPKNTLTAKQVKGIKSFLSYLTILVISFCISILVYREHPLKFFENSIPLAGDGLFLANYLSNILDSNWVQVISGKVQDSTMGWPYVSNFSLFPIGNLADFVIMKILNDLFVFQDISSLIHTYVVLRYSLTAVITYTFFKKLDIGPGLNFTLTSSFTFSVYTLTRAEGHFVLGSVWTLPLALLCFNQLAAKYRNHSKKKNWVLYCGFILVGLNNFYYAIFTIIVAMAVFLLVGIGSRIKWKSNDFNMEIRGSLKGCFFILFGLTVQLFPIIYEQSKELSFYDLADRTSLEAYYYGGNLLSASWPLVSTFLNLVNQNAILEFYRSQVIWEASQLGIFTALTVLAIFIGLIYMAFIVIIKGAIKFNIHHRVSVTALWLAVALFLYFRNPFTMVLTGYFGSIRAWSRITPLITLLCLTLVALLIKNSNKQWLINTFIFVLLICNIFELNGFRESRPSADVLKNVAVQNANHNESVLQYVKSLTKEKCGVAQIPIYPYPEFDTPIDNKIDYWQLALAEAAKKKGIRLSGGTFKNSLDFRIFQPLLFEVPPYKRASIAAQISYLYQLGACSALVDSQALYPEEDKELQKLFPPKTISDDLEFPKPIAESCWNKIDKLYIVKLSRVCFINLFTNNESLMLQIKSLQADIENSKLFWRNVTPNSIGYAKLFPQFDVSQELSFEYFLDSKFPRDANLVVQIDRISEKKDLSFDVCINNSDSQELNCTRQSILKGTRFFVLDITLYPREKTFLRVKLKESENSQNLKSYGAILLNDKVNSDFLK